MADEKPDKMALWNRHATSNPKDLKEVTYGRTFHSIDAHSQLKNGTDEWGPLGSGWGWKGEIKTQFTHAPDGTEDGVLAQAVFFYRDADGKMYEFPVLDDIEIWHEKDGKRVYNNEYAKKLQTSMRSKALFLLQVTPLFADDVIVPRLDLVANGFNQVTAVRSPHDGTKRLFVVERQ